MKCYFAHRFDGKHLIPGCLSVVNHMDIEFCTCKNDEAVNFESFHKKEFNKAIQEKNDIIKEYQAEIKALNAEIEKLKKGDQSQIIFNQKI